MATPPKHRVALSPTAYGLHHLFRRFHEVFPETYQTIFVPELSYEQVGINAYSTRLAGDEAEFLRKSGKAFPLFAYTRGPLQRFDDQQFRFKDRSFFVYEDDTGEKMNMYLSAAMTRVQIMFRAYFQSPEEYEKFESNYQNNLSINEFKYGEVQVPYLDQVAKYTAIWSDLDEVDWSVGASNYVASSFSLEMHGPSLMYRSDKQPLKAIILEVRDMQNPDVLYFSHRVPPEDQTTP